MDNVSRHQSALQASSIGQQSVPTTPVPSSQQSPTQGRAVWTGFSGKTLWDWLDLLSKLVLPFLILFATQAFTNQQSQLSNTQHNNDVVAANTQHDRDVAATKDQQQQTALDTYINNMSDLLVVVDNKNKLQNSTSPNDEVRRVARARTIIVLTTLDSERKRFVIQFLFDTKLIKNDSPSKTDHPFVKLDFANLDGADLNGMNLGNVDLHDLFMRNANLHYAYLLGSNISKSYLKGSDFSHASLHATDFHMDSLQSVNFSNADLSYANLNSAYDNTGRLIRTDLSSANLSGANLGSAQLESAILRGINLSSANLKNADLTDTDLTGAYILGPDRKTKTLVTISQLEQQTSLLHGATMPDGSIHP